MVDFLVFLGASILVSKWFAAFYSLFLHKLQGREREREREINCGRTGAWSIL